MGKDKDPEKAAKKAAKAAKRAAEEAAEAPPTKVAKTDDEEPKVKLSKEEKAAKKAAKEAKKAAKGEVKEEEETTTKKDKKKKKDKEADDDESPKKAKTEDLSADAPAVEARVYVGNLPFSMTDDWIKEEFQSAGAVTKTDWLSHADTGRFKGSGFITFASEAEAAKAVELNGKELEGRPMKVELATPRKAAPPGGFGGSGDLGEPTASIFCGNLSWNVTEDQLKEAFSSCGEISRIKWVEKDGEFKGICFIDFNSIEDATKAVALAGTQVAGRPLRINFSKPKEPAAGGKGGAWKDKPGGAGGRTERPYKPQGAKPDGCLELFCGNLPWSIDEAKIATFFKGAGAEVASTRWLNDKETGEFKGIGFVAFHDTESVDKAVTLGGENLDGRPIRLDYAGQKKEKPAGAWQGGGGW